jgi:hypothetical protein
VRPTKRAPDGWWAPPKKRILASSFFRFVGWLSQPPVTQAVETVEKVSFQKLIF